MEIAVAGVANTREASSNRRVDVLLALRAALLVLTGLAIAFTAPLHENIAFNRSVFVLLCAGLIVLGALGFVRSRRDRSSEIAPAALGALALVAGVVTLATSSASTFAIILLVWAAITALVELGTGIVTKNRESLVTGVLAGLLAVVLGLAGGDPVAVIGFLGAYGVLSGVYLAIAAFDFTPATGTTPGTAQTTNTEIAGS